jgi:hypothetical protein
MRVQELINHLRDMPSDAEVVICLDHGYAVPIDKAKCVRLEDREDDAMGLIPDESADDIEWDELEEEDEDDDLEEED